jgi:hypothetical protein
MNPKYLALIVSVIVLLSIVLASTGYSYWHSATALPKADLSIQVVYVYLTHSTANSEGGFNYDTLKGEGYNLTSYVIILKVSNNGAQMVSMTPFRAVLAQHITENKIGFNDSNGNPAPGGLGGPSFEISNPMVTDDRAGMASAGFSNYLDAKSSKLIALTGVVSLNKFDQQYLQSGHLSVWVSVTAQTGYASGQSVWGPDSQSANDVEQVTLRQIGNDYLYNVLLSTNQTLIIDGLDATVEGNR